MDAETHLERLTTCLSRLPGIGKRSAARIAYRLMGESRDLARTLIDTLQTALNEVRTCPQCGCLTVADQTLCHFCVGTDRDSHLLCVVEDPGDIPAIEKTGGFRGRYHALMGHISPMQGISPDDLRISALLDRVRKEGIEEVILALNTHVESDSTAIYLAERLKPLKVRVTRPAFGLPAASGIGYADPLTLSRAMTGRNEVIPGNRHRDD
jgi:recombination protein RecR